MQGGSEGVRCMPAWRPEKAGPTSALHQKKVFDSFRTDPRSGLALVWHRELDLMEHRGPWELGAVSCLPSVHWEARCRSRDVDERGEDGRILGGEITISEWIEGV